MTALNGTANTNEIADVLQDEVSIHLETGVYCWRNKINGKVYVGSASVSFEQRKRKHLIKLRKGVSDHPYLLHAWNKYGEESFEWIILWRCLPDECIQWEQWWIDKFRAADSRYGYNMNPTAGSRLGSKVSEETKAKVSAASKKMHADPNFKDRHSSIMRGVRARPGYMEKLSKALKISNANPESRAKKSATLKKTLASPEAKARKSEAMKKSNADPSVRAKKSAGMKKFRAEEKAMLEALIAEQSIDTPPPAKKLR